MAAESQALSLPYFQFISARTSPEEQVFYWLHWIAEAKPHRAQVILNFADAKQVTRFFLRAAEPGKPPADPVRLPRLELTCRAEDFTVVARDASGAQTITFNRRAAINMSCALGTSGLAVPGVGDDPAAFAELDQHPLHARLAAGGALQEVRDLPAFHILANYPCFRDLAERALTVQTA